MADAGRIAKALLKRYPKPATALLFSNPLELLIATILSAQCTDVRVNDVTRTLFSRYRFAEDYAGADLNRFEEEIRPTGFYRNKAKSIVACCRKIVEDFDGHVPDSLDKLVSLPGVGRKTANLVLGSAFGKQTMAVDTHVLRVSLRLGLTRQKAPDKVEEDLVRSFPKGKLTALNLAMILHGRETCRAKRPLCPGCVLFSLCRWPDKSVS
jgi:endonuclease-3